MGTMPITWQFIREEHHRVVSKTRNRVERCYLKAKIAADKALSGVTAAEGFRHDLEQSLRVSDFYNESLIARAVADKPPGTVQGALAEGAQGVSHAIELVTSRIAKVTSTAQNSLKASGEAQHFGAQANTAAKEGRTEDVKNFIERMEQEVKKAEEESEKVMAAKEEVRTNARDACHTWQFVREEHRRAINNIIDHIDRYCSDTELAVNRTLSDAKITEEVARNLEQNLRADGFYDESSAARITFTGFQIPNIQIQAPRTETLAKTKVGKILVATKEVEVNVIQAIDAAQVSLKLISKARHLRAKVEATAGEGRMRDLEGFVTRIKTGLEAAEQESTKAAAAKKAARDYAEAAHLAWLSVRERHRERVTEVAGTVDKASIRAESLSTLAQAEVETARQHENASFILAANAARDARIAHQVRLTDFYTELAAAWTQLADYRNSVKRVVGNAIGLSDIASDLQNMTDKISGGNIRAVTESCDEVLNYALSLKLDGEKIWEKVDGFRRTAAKANKGKEMQAMAAAGGVTTLMGISADVQAAAEAACLVRRKADETRQHAVDAKTAIALGSGDEAEAAIREIEVALEKCENGFQTAVQKRKDVQAKMAQFSAAAYLNMVADSDSAR